MAASCQNPLGSGGEGPDSGTDIPAGMGALTFGLDSGGMLQTIDPPVSMREERYEVEGRGPAGAEFSVELDSSSNRKRTVHVVPGSWTVTVRSYNSSGIHIGTGSAAAEVRPDRVTSVPVAVYLREGRGALEVNITWSDELEDPEGITAHLYPIRHSGSGANGELGNPVAVQSEIAGSSGRVQAGDMDAGTWVLAVSLGNGLDGFAEVLWILDGRTTTFSADVNVLTGEVSLTDQSGHALRFPMSVSMTELYDYWEWDGGLPVRAHAYRKPRGSDWTERTGETTFYWFRNGELQKAKSEGEAGFDDGPVYNDGKTYDMFPDYLGETMSLVGVHGSAAASGSSKFFTYPGAYRVDIETSGNGTAEIADASSDFGDGYLLDGPDSYAVQASPGAGYVFDSWSVAVGSDKVHFDDPGSPVTTVHLDGFVYDSDTAWNSVVLHAGFRPAKE